MKNSKQNAGNSSKKPRGRQNNNRKAIYDFLRNRGTVAPLESRWNFLEPDNDTRITEFGPPLVADLRQRFDPEALQAAGLFTSENRLPSELEGSTQLLYFLRRETGRIVDVVTQQETLRGQVPLFAVWGAQPEGNSRILVPFAAEDLVILRALGLAAAPAYGLDRLARNGLQKLLYWVGGSTSGSLRRLPVVPPGRVPPSRPDVVGKREDEPARLEVVFCAFSLAALNRDLPSKLTPIAQHLADANKYLETDFEQVFVWHPTVNEIGHLEFLVGLGDQKLIADFLGAAHTFAEVESFSRPGPLPQPRHRVAQTMEDLQRAAARNRKLRSTGSQEEMRRAEERLSQQLEQCLLQPLFEVALATPSVLRRSLLVLYATYVSVAHRLIPRLTVEMDDLTLANPASQLPMESIELLEKITKLICQVLKALVDLDDANLDDDQ